VCVCAVSASVAFWTHNRKKEQMRENVFKVKPNFEFVRVRTKILEKNSSNSKVNTFFQVMEPQTERVLVERDVQSK